MEITPWKLRTFDFCSRVEEYEKLLNEWIKIVESILYGLICLFHWYWDFFGAMISKQEKVNAAT